MASEAKANLLAGTGTQVVRAGLPSPSVVIPAFNEERYLAETLDHLRTAEEFLRTHAGTGGQLVVVDCGPAGTSRHHAERTQTEGKSTWLT